MIVHIVLRFGVIASELFHQPDGIRAKLKPFELHSEVRNPNESKTLVVKICPQKHFQKQFSKRRPDPLSLNIKANRVY